MRVLGIISEYNPFHNGHAYQIEISKKELSCSHSIAVMSGNYTQRGEIAIFDKFTRAQCAVSGGIDLVLELPCAYALSSADFFTAAAVKLLNGLGVVDYLSFGSEAGQLEPLYKAAEILADSRTKYKIRELMKDGIPVFTAMEKLVGRNVLNTPNNVLGVHYLKNLIEINSPIKPYTLERKAAGYHSLVPADNFASAAALRQMLKDKQDISPYLPRPVYQICKDIPPIFEDLIEKTILYAIRMKEPEGLTHYADVSEGLENKLYNAVMNSANLEEAVRRVKSKRYSHTRIKRIIYNIFLDIEKSFRSRNPEYARILAFNDKGREILSRMRGNEKINLIPKITKKAIAQYDMLALELKADKAYELFCANKVPANLWTATFAD